MDIKKDLNLGWIPIYHELSLKLLEYKNNRQPLVDMISNCYRKNFFTDMCPLTAMNLLNLREVDGTRNKRLIHYSKSLGVEIGDFKYSPLEDAWKETIPLSLPIQNSNALFFNPRYIEKPAIDRLWNMFETSLDYADNVGKNREDFIKNYDALIRMKGITSLRLSKILYTLRPYVFPTLDENVNTYIQILYMARKLNNNIFAVENAEYNGTGYLNAAEALADEFTNKYEKEGVFIGLSYAAYVDTGSASKVKQSHTIKQMNNSLAPPPKLYGIDTELPKENSNPGGERSKYAGKLICIPKVFLEINKSPRKPGTNGGKDWAMVHKYLKENPGMEGIPYEEYLKRGGGFTNKQDGQVGTPHIRWNIMDGGGWQYIVQDPNHVGPIISAPPEEDKTTEPENEIMKKHPLNQILYGPPGTGKTYQTTQLAVEILTGQRHKTTITPEERKEIVEKYHEFKKQKRIRFITFHQSYGYEEFVEGIKPKITSDDSNAQEKSSSDIEYQIKPGIFRQICADAEEVEPPKNVWAVRLWLGPKKKEEKEFKQKCFDSDYIVVKEKAPGLKKFKESCAEGDLIIVPAYSSGKDWKVVAIGRLKSNTKNLHTDKGILRWDVKWIWHELEQPKSLAKYWTPDRKKTSLAVGTIMQQIEGINTKMLLKDLPKVHFDEEAKRKPYVLIIDEINRGNISKILGELITLLEEDKRSGGGNKEALEVTLPYSNDPFSVPNNLYIIGTMNTADRSIAFLDTALRRRFKFEAIMPNPDLLEQEIKGIELKELLKAMNNKIKEHLGRDHQIGHSYFLKVKDLEDLMEVFRNDICPLLDEYFYDRRELIADVLNKSALIYKDGDKDTTWEWAKDKDFKELKNYTKIYGK